MNHVRTYRVVVVRPNGTRLPLVGSLARQMAEEVATLLETTRPGNYLVESDGDGDGSAHDGFSPDGKELLKVAARARRETIEAWKQLNCTLQESRLILETCVARGYYHRPR